ncbi:GFA family protein [Myxococcus virescens]|uniref:CENP-V/GFA domain-containing protein n=2 Tax=Myxococcus virescens TaxID=83456 RepID=A0A511HLB7_9BACT|nr:hypothetical protein [Myxococcus virescens]GEL74370.1 hypothetical protein MVI01_61540 [Myxococcus virescens]
MSVDTTEVALMVIPGKCHCGNLSFTLVWEPSPDEIPARACGCSFCVKHVGVWTSHPGGTLKISVQEPAQVSRYVFGTRTAEFHSCGRCGVVPVVTSLIDGQLYAVVNVNAFEGIDPARIRRSSGSFDDEDAATRLARRKRNWIANVEMLESPRP